MKKVIITLLCIAILGGGGYAGAMKYKKSWPSSPTKMMT